MSDASKYLAIRRIATSSSQWTPVTAPIDCAQIVIENGDGTNAQAVRTDKDDGTTEKTLPASLELTLRASTRCWVPGDIICYVQAASGTGPVIVSFLR